MKQKIHKLFTSDEYDFMDMYEHVKQGTKRKHSSVKYNHMLKQVTKNEDKRYEALCTIRRAIVKRDGASFLSSGARYPVCAGETPRNTSSVMQKYRPKC